ncbi:hypothetical protein [Campylobacter sp. MIT 99-7217]|nr:hypothetical protein [Campylobacter sp. MIT 99-7217]
MAFSEATLNEFTSFKVIAIGWTGVAFSKASLNELCLFRLLA